MHGYQLYVCGSTVGGERILSLQWTKQFESDEAALRQVKEELRGERLAEYRLVRCVNVPIN